jgi:hypothetical protein
MPGDISCTYAAPICKCGHFKFVHSAIAPHPCGDGCDCQAFEEVPISETRLGKSVDLWLSGYAPINDYDET